jgi:PAS domain S-box-containing protein/diguanylate cyclase (GGDEF)-like protein
MQWLHQLYRFYKNNPLSLRILAYILVVSTLFTTIVTSVQLYADYNEDIRRLNDRLSDSEKSSFPSLIDSLWRIDKNSVQLNLNAMQNLPYVAYVSLETTDGGFYKAGQLPDTKNISVRSYDLQKDLPDEKPVLLGTLRIHIDKSAIYDSLLNKLLVILGSQTAKTFAVSVFILLILHFTIMRHLSLLAGFAENLTLMNLDDAFTLNRPSNSKQSDELNIVAHSINRMRQRLKEDLEALDHAKQTTRKLTSAIEASPASIAIMSHEGVVEFVNNSFTRLTGLSTEHIKGRNWLDKLESMLPKEKLSGTTLDSYLARKGEIMFEQLWKDHASVPKWLYIHISVLRNNNGKVDNYLLIMDDITTIKEYEKQVIEHRDYDPLTHLPNLVHTMQEICRQTESAEKSQSHVAVIAISIGAYRSIAESMGIGFADLLLRDCAEKLRAVVPGGAFIGRGGENKFLVILTFSGSMSDVEMFLKKLRTELSVPIQLNNYPVDTHFSAGIAMSPNDGNNAQTLYKNALTAQNRARDNEQRYEFFEADMGKSSFRRLQIASLLKSLPGSEELQINYQPIVDPRTGRYISMESLVRWHSKELGFVSPVEFISIAEKTGDIIAIGEYILTSSCAQAQKWNETGNPVDISVNVSPLQFLDSAFVGVVCKSLEASGLAPEHLKLEITEQLMMEGSQKVRNKAEQLVKLGIRLAIDDFGTGYSSLSYLREIPFSTVKIDQTFVRHMHKNSNDQTLVRTIIDLAHNFGMEVIAEGVETSQQASILAGYGCDLLQGYYYSKPLPADQHFRRSHLALIKSDEI